MKNPAGAAAFAMTILLTMALLSAARADDCTRAELAGFDIAYRAALIPVALDGSGYAFMVDTGGYVSTLSPGVIGALHLQPAPVGNGDEIYMSDGTVLDQQVTVGQLQLGQSSIAAVRFVVQPQQSRSGLERFEGTLASDVLRNFDLDFDFGHRRLKLFSPAQCLGKPAYWTADPVEIPFRRDAASHIIVPVKLDGVQTSALIDTGSSVTVMSEELAKRAFGLAPGAGLDPWPGTGDGALVRYKHAFQTLELNGLEIDHPTVGILPDETARSILIHHTFKMADPRPTGPAMNATPVIIGLDVLRKLHLYVDYRNEMLYVTAANVADAEDPAPPQAMPAATP